MVGSAVNVTVTVPPGKTTPAVELWVSVSHAAPETAAVNVIAVPVVVNVTAPCTGVVAVERFTVAGPTVRVGKVVTTFRIIGIVVTTPSTVTLTEVVYWPVLSVVGFTRTVRVADRFPVVGVIVIHSIAPDVPGGMAAENAAVADVPAPAFMATVCGVGNAAPIS